MNNLLLKSKDKTTVLTQTAFGVALLSLLLFGAPASAETSAEPSLEPMIEEIAYDDAGAQPSVSVEPIEPLSADQLGELVGPIALYPDSLIASLLPASTEPMDVIQAARWVAGQKGEIKELPIVLKADVQGSLDVLEDTLRKLKNDKVEVKLVHTGVGAVSESDILLAMTADAIVKTAAREGLHAGAAQCALVNSTPRLARRSMFGVSA